MGLPGARDGIGRLTFKRTNLQFGKLQKPEVDIVGDCTIAWMCLTPQTAHSKNGYVCAFCFLYIS